MNDIKEHCQKLAVQIKKGGYPAEKAMRELIIKLKKAGFTFIRHKLSGILQRKPGLDEDVFQDAIIALFEKIRDNGLENIPGYFYIILRNHCIDILNQAEKNIISIEERSEWDSYVDAIQEDIDLKITIEECIKIWKNKMPKNWEVFELHYVQGYKYDEIAKQLNKGLSAVKVNSNRFLQKIRECVNQ